MHPSLLLVIFAVELFTVIVNSVGAAAINGLVRLQPPELPMLQFYNSGVRQGRSFC